MSSDRPLSVAERIAALHKSASNDNSSTSSSSGGGRKKVSALAGDLSTKLNMNALLAGGSVGGGGIGGVPRRSGGNRPLSSANHHVEATTADPSRSTTPTMSTKLNDDKEITKEGRMCHPPRAMIPPGRRRRRGGR